MPLLGNYSVKKRPPIDYHQKTLENPFYKRKNRISPLTGLKVKLASVAVILFLAFVFWFLIVSSFWKIKEISVIGPDQMTITEIKDLITSQINGKDFLFLPQNSLLFFNEQKFRETLKGKYRFQKVAIEKKWPNKLNIEIAEKPLACIWLENEKYYYVDTDGYVVQEINPLDIKDKKYPLASNESDNKISNSKIQADQAYVEAASRLYESIAAKSLGLTIDRFVIGNEIDTIKVQTTAGLLIIFDTKGDLDKQLNRLYVLKTQKLKDDFAGITQIDLRYGDKIYYK